MKHLIPLLLMSIGCQSVKYSEQVTPDGYVRQRSLDMRGNLNLATSGDLGNRSDSLIPFSSNDSRTTVVNQESTLTGDRPTIKMGDFEFYGTLDRTAPTAAAGRSVTGMLAEVRKIWVRVTGIKAWESEKIAKHGRDVDLKGIESDTAIAVDNNATEVAIEGIKSETAIELQP